MADVGSATIAEQEQIVDGAAVERAPFHLTLSECPPSSNRYALRAEARQRDPSQLTVGDYTSTIAIVWRPDLAREHWEIPVNRI